MTDITQKAMLAGIQISHWTARKHDRRISDKVATDHAASPEAGRYNKLLLARDTLQDIVKIMNKARSSHYMNTLPWDDEGYRILPAANYLDYMQTMGAFQRKFEAAVTDFLEHYPTYKEEARKSLGEMFVENDYPDPGYLFKKFSFDIRINPMPSAEDFRVDLSKAHAEMIKSDIEQRLLEGQKKAMADIWERIHAAVSKMKDKLEGFRRNPETNKVEGRFRDTLVTNIQDLVAIMPRLNMTGDPELDLIAKELANSLCQYDAQTLREDAELRRKTAAEADQILQQMAGYVDVGGDE